MSEKKAALDSLIEIGRRFRDFESKLLTPEQLEGLERLLKHVDEIDPPPPALLKPGYSVPRSLTVVNVEFTDVKAEGQSTEDISADSDGSIVTWVEGDTRYISTQRKGQKIALDDSNAGTIFYSDNTLKNIINLDRLETSGVTSMLNMFNGCSNLLSLDLSGFDTTSVTKIHQMFSGCSALQEINLSGLTFKGMTSLESLFDGCKSLKQIDVSGIDASLVTNFIDVFSNCSQLTEITGLENFNTSSAVTYCQMFENCSALDMLDLSNFQIKKVQETTNMFNGCSNLKTIYASEWATEGPSTLRSNSSGMFSKCSSLPNYGSGQSITMAKWKENGGYFTNPAEKQ